MADTNGAVKPKKAAPKPSPTVAALISEVRELRGKVDELQHQVDCAVWCFAEFIFQLKQAAYLKAIQQAGPELARQLASGQLPPAMQQAGMMQPMNQNAPVPNLFLQQPQQPVQPG